MRLVSIVVALAACTGEPTFRPPDTSVETDDTEVIDTDTDDTVEETDTETGTDDDGDGFTVEEGDCDDSDIWINPGWPERPDDERDNDCDGLVDEEFAGITLVDSGGGTALLDIDLVGDVDRTVNLAGGYTPGGLPAAVQIGPRLDAAPGWALVDGGKALLVELDDKGVRTVIWDDSATEYTEEEAPVGYFGVANHPDGWYAVSGGDRLWRVDPDGTAIVLAQWDCLEGPDAITDLCPFDVAIDRFSGEVVLFGVFGGYATWNEGIGLDLIVPDVIDPYAQTHAFWSTQIVDDGTRLALGQSVADGVTGIFEWDAESESYLLWYEWVDSNYVPVDIAVDQITRDVFASANRDWFPYVVRIVPEGPYQAILYPSADVYNPLSPDYDPPASDHDAQSIAVRYSYAQ